MAYTRTNHLKRVNLIMQAYQAIKELDVPDTRILKKLETQGIIISRRTLVNYKGMKPSEYRQQPTLFD